MNEGDHALSCIEKLLMSTKGRCVGRKGDEEHATRFEEAFDVAQRNARIIQMFDHITKHDHIESMLPLFGNVLIDHIVFAEIHVIARKLGALRGPNA